MLPTAGGQAHAENEFPIFVAIFLCSDPLVESRFNFYLHFTHTFVCTIPGRGHMKSHHGKAIRGQGPGLAAPSGEVKST